MLEWEGERFGNEAVPVDCWKGRERGLGMRRVLELKT